MSMYAIRLLMFESRWCVILAVMWKVQSGSTDLFAAADSRCLVAPLELCSEMKVLSWAVYAGLFVYIHHLRPLDVYLAAPPLRLSHLLACVYFTFPGDTSYPESSVGPLEFSCKTPRCCITSRNLPFDWHSEVLPNNDLCWIKRPCERAYPSRLIAAIISLFHLLSRSSRPAFARTNRQAGSSAGVLDYSEESAMVPSLCRAGDSCFSSRTLFANLKWFRLPIFCSTANRETTCENTRISCFASI